MPLRLSLVTLPVVVLLGSCAQSTTTTRDCYGDPSSCVDSGGTDDEYVIDELLVPTSADDAVAMGLDLDGNGQADNQLGKALVLFSLQTEVDTRLQRGDSILLADLRATDLTQATDAGVWVLNGDNPSPAPCSGGICGQHLHGDATFGVATNTPDSSLVTGAVTAGHFDGGPGHIAVNLALSQSGQPLALDLIGAHVQADVSADGLTNGILAGAIPEEDMATDVLPAVADVLAEIIAQDCPYQAPDCCVSQTNGDVLVSLLDTNGDCQVSVSELANNTYVEQLLHADVDLRDNHGDYNPGVDGVNDAVSLAVGFTATTASFPAP